MNARKVMNATLATLLFGWSMAAALPALNQDVLSPFEAFVLTPGLLMLATLAALGAYHGLDRLQQRLHERVRRAIRHRVPRSDSAPSLDGCLLGRSR
jgi:hypothetical protein